jgi:hypothetical protein
MVGATLAVALLWMGDPSSLFSHSGRPFLSQVAYEQATLPTRAPWRTCSGDLWYHDEYVCSLQAVERGQDESSF